MRAVYPGNLTLTKTASYKLVFLQKRERGGMGAVIVVVVQSLSRVPLSVTPMDCSMPGLPVLHQLPDSITNSMDANLGELQGL